MNLVQQGVRIAVKLPGLRDIVPWLASRRVVVVGDSMYPLLQPGDVLLCDPFGFAGRRIARGDIVVFQHGSSPHGRMIKLVAGLPGERVEVRNDRLWVNGREVDFHSPMVGSLPGHWNVGVGELFVLSYAVAVGTDSRSYGPIQQSRVLGRGWFVLSPASRAGRVGDSPLRLLTTTERP